MKKYLCFFLILILLLTSCSNTPKTPDPDAFFYYNGGEKIYTDSFNQPHKAGQISAFNREYKIDGEHSVYAEAGSDSLAISITKDRSSTAEIKKGEAAPIPTNGILIIADKNKDQNTANEYRTDNDKFLDDIDMTKAYISDENGIFIIPLNYKDPEDIPDGSFNTLFQSASSNTISPAGDYYMFNIKRNSDGKFKITGTNTNTISKREFTIYLKDSYSIAVAKEFTEGELIIMENTSAITKYGDKTAVIINGILKTLDGINPDTIENNSVYLFDDHSSFDKERNINYTDITVVAGKIANISINEKAIFPTQTGYVITLTGDKGIDTAGILGCDVDTVLYEINAKSSNYVDIGGYIVELDYFNESRTAYSPAVLYDRDFYAAYTKTNIWGLEIAVTDGKITKVVPAAGENSGNTLIPENGYVISIGMDHKYYSSLSRISEGTEVVLHLEKTPYTYYNMSIAGLNKDHDGETLVVYDREYGKKTPVITDGIELVCDNDGRITGTGSISGETNIPENGFIVSAMGAKRNEIRRIYKIGSLISFNKTNTTLTIINTPETLAGENQERLNELKENYDHATENLWNIDYDSVESLLTKTGSMDKQELLKNAVVISNDLDYAEYRVFPSPGLQNRGAWLVTNDTDEAMVRKTLEYASSLNINALYIDIFNGVYSIYDSSVDGVIKAPGYGDFDALEAYCRLAGEYGIEIHAMVCCFKAGTTLTGLPEGHYINKYSDKMLLSKKGRNAAYFYEDVSYTLNPYDPVIREFQLEIINEILNNYDIDGLQLDYIRFPLPSAYGEDNYEDFGYNDNIINAFMQEYGSANNPRDMKTTDPMWETWCGFRRDIITSFVEEVYKAVDSRVYFSVTCFADYDDRQKYIFQDTEKFVENGWVDEVFSMIYAEDTETHEKYGSDLKQRIGNGSLLTLGLGTYVNATEKTLALQSVYSTDINTDGIAVFGLAYINSGKYDNIFKKGIFRTGSVQTYLANASVAAGAKDIMETIDNVYKRFYKDIDFNKLYSFFSELEKSALSADITDENKALYLENTINELEQCKNDLDFTDNRLSADIGQKIDYIIGCLKRTPGYLS